MHPLEQSLYHQLQNHHPPARRLLLAVSGGSDSVALLRLLLALEDRLELTLQVAHFHHHIRPHECQRDADFTVQLCETLGVPCLLESADIPRIALAKGMNQEACSRQLRYAFLHKAAKKMQADYVVTAHTQDDQAETVLMQLMRGTAFLRGMALQRRKLLRPLLPFSRQQLQDYLQTIEQDYVVDTTNFDTSFSRAWLRHELLPFWQQRQPQIKKKLAALAGKQQAYEAHFDTVIAPWVATKERAWLQQANSAVQRHALARLLQAHDVAVDDGHLDTILSSLAQSETNARIALPQHHYVRFSDDDVQIFPQKARHPLPKVVDWQHLPVQLDAEKVAQFPDVMQRYRQSGDTIQLEQGSKSLKQLMIDKKIAREDRDRIPLIASGSQVLWVQDVAVDVRVKSDYRSHAYWMGLALEQAQQAFDKGEVPVGAVVVQHNTLLASAHNLSESKHDPSAHAEVLALRQAAQALQDWRLQDCRLYVTLEPCMMCFGAMLQAHLTTLIYGASNPREGALGGVAYLQHHTWKRKLNVIRGVRAKEARAILKTFFADQREA